MSTKPRRLLALLYVSMAAAALYAAKDSGAAAASAATALLNKEKTNEAPQVVLDKKPALNKEEQHKVLQQLVLHGQVQVLAELYQARPAEKPSQSTPLVGFYNATRVYNEPLMEGPPRASAIEKLGLTLFSTLPSIQGGAREDGEKLKKLLAEKPDLLKALQEQFDKLKSLEPSLLSLWKLDQDPLFSLPYKKKLVRYGAPDGVFTSWGKTEFIKRIYDGLLVLALVGIIKFSNRSRNAYPGNLFQAALWGAGALVVAYVAWGQYQQAKAIKNYIAGRLADVYLLLQITHALLDVVTSDPALINLCMPRLQHTIKLLRLDHEEAKVNKGINNFLTCNFTKWRLFFNSMGTLLTTMSWLEANIHVLDDLIVELAWLGSQVAVAEPLSTSKTTN